MKRLSVMTPSLCFAATLALCLMITPSCNDPQEAPTVRLPIVVDASGVTPLTTDLGYEVTVTSARVVIQDLKLSVAGEVHAASRSPRSYQSQWWWTSKWWTSCAPIPMAHAHPGHEQGGEVTGELLGEFVVEWPADEDRELGAAMLIAGEYSSSQFTFGYGSAKTLNDGDPLIGHTAVIVGTATKSEQTVSFTVVIDAPEGRALVGAPFEAMIREDTTGTLGLRLDVVDSAEGDTLFDAIDFAALDSDRNGSLVIEPENADLEEAYYTLRRAFLSHDHYSVVLQE